MIQLRVHFKMDFNKIDNFLSRYAVYFGIRKFKSSEIGGKFMSVIAVSQGEHSCCSTDANKSFSV
jgi:hypothetical protein